MIHPSDRQTDGRAIPYSALSKCCYVLKMHQIRFPPQTPLGELNYSTPPDTLAGFKGLNSKGGEGKERKELGREGNARVERGGRGGKGGGSSGKKRKGMARGAFRQIKKIRPHPSRKVKLMTPIRLEPNITKTAGDAI